MSACDRVPIRVALERKDQLARRRPRPGQAPADGARDLRGDDHIAMTHGDVPALMLEAGEQLFIVEGHERARRDHDLRAAQAGDRDEDGAVGQNHALRRTRSDRCRA